VTDPSSTPETTSASATLETNTHRVEAVNSTTRSEDDEPAPLDSPKPFDFEVTSETDAPQPTATVLELFAGYLAAASHACSDVLDEAFDVTRVVVDAAVPSDVDATPTYQSAVTSLSATLHVETSAADAALERWRRTVRDAEPTQEAVPADVSVSLAVRRVLR
jgi:hypothetical protein